MEIRKKKMKERKKNSRKGQLFTYCKGKMTGPPN
jgi:hypothetical protein